METKHYDPIEDLKQNHWNDLEIEIIINHFLDGGMLSEIIAPANKTMRLINQNEISQSALKREEISESVEALKRFDQYFSAEKEKNINFANELREKWINRPRH
ncbi:MAG: hypothetical protein WC606_04055 [Candidatus Absconditabacterales bacterium]|jgi:hypothetical protein